MNYVGTELELFQHAVNWKRYWSAQVAPFVHGNVLDVGCGLGVNAAYVTNDSVTGYTFLEPDGKLLQQVGAHVPLPPTIRQRLIEGTTDQVKGEHFETLLYIDVLEHIEDATAELLRANELLATGGHLIIVVPAYPFLYSPFDRAIGHYRRYTERMLDEQMPPSLQKILVRYLDSAGFVLSLGNKLLLRRTSPTRAQIAFWDRRIVPLSRITDKVVGHTFGRSMVAVYRKA
ncbi:MAG: methyltransferase domain-containing protein [Flavobacteriales bacterium]|nr:methyltransferase domain-containing protein [Flavobacteriales bacterium]